MLPRGGADAARLPEPSPHCANNCPLLQLDRGSEKPAAVTRVAPLPHLHVVKDLVVDLSNFFAQARYVCCAARSSCMGCS
jgi:succinate dehydrogenase/fumarate reductase-like Fe-S protein